MILFSILEAALYKLDRYVEGRNEKPVYPFLSHFLLDHIIGLIGLHAWPKNIQEYLYNSR